MNALKVEFEEDDTPGREWLQNAFFIFFGLAFGDAYVSTSHPEGCPCEVCDGDGELEAVPLYEAIREQAWVNPIKTESVFDF